MGRGGGHLGVLRGLRPVEAVRIIVFLAHGKVELIFGSCKSLRGEQWPFVFVDCQSLASNIEQTYVGQVSIGQASEASSPCPVFFWFIAPFRFCCFNFPFILASQLQ